MRTIAVLPGDGAGPEVARQGVKILRWAGQAAGEELEIREYLAGGAAIAATGDSLPDETLEACKAADAVLFGAVGSPEFDHLPREKRAEQAVLKLRKELGLFANLRPATLYAELAGASPLREEIAGKGFDILMVRELTGGIYFGEKGVEQGPDGRVAFDTERYAEYEVERIARVAFEAALGRRRKLVSVDKANVLETSRLFRSVVDRVAEGYPDVEVSHLYVDNAAMQLIRDPAQFDVMLTSNLFGDILSDEASVLTGSIGMLPSASVGEGAFGLYEPIHGSAPDIAGKDIVNPLGSILSVAMLLRHSFDMAERAGEVEAAVRRVLSGGYRTTDMMTAGARRVGTEEMGDLVAAALNEVR
ncbi:MAG: 3-isopropylmalate dehydrogenase [Anaerovoracaceae bacterium]